MKKEKNWQCRNYFHSPSNPFHKQKYSGDSIGWWESTNCRCIFSALLMLYGKWMLGSPGVHCVSCVVSCHQQLL